MGNGVTDTVKLPPLRDLIGHQCPDCGTGVAVITSYDPDALHESGENAKIVGDTKTGGTFAWSCPNCGHSGSVAANDLGSWIEPGPFAETQPEAKTESTQSGEPSGEGGAE